jgi:hypothetical protein
MAKSINVKQKNKRGRPATGTDPLVGIRFPSADIARIDDWAARHYLSRSEAIRRLVEEGLATAQPRKQAARMAPLKSEPPGMKRDSRGNAFPLKKRASDDQAKAKR